MFAVQYGGECYTGPEALQTFDKYGRAKDDDCQDGLGGRRRNSVYTVGRCVLWPSIQHDTFPGFGVWSFQHANPTYPYGFLMFSFDFSPRSHYTHCTPTQIPNDIAEICCFSFLPCGHLDFQSAVMVHN